MKDLLTPSLPFTPSHTLQWTKRCGDGSMGPSTHPWGVGVVVVVLITMGTLTRAMLYSPKEKLQLREDVRRMFSFAYDNYKRYAFPYDELKPISCGKKNWLGGVALTLIDALDTLALMGNMTEFAWGVKWVSDHVTFDVDSSVSVFETNIRVLGGLLSSHFLASDTRLGAVPDYDGKLLQLAEDLGRRLLPAFDTPTGIPYGTVNLRSGVPAGETQITSTATGGTLVLEFTVLSHLTGDPRFEEAARKALKGLWARRSVLDLVGNHINVFTGSWTNKDAGVGAGIDSFYEYLLKAYFLFGDTEYLYIFQKAYAAILKHARVSPWYIEVNMENGIVVWPLFNALQAFWPGLQVMYGDLDSAYATQKGFHRVWRMYGFTPEGFNLETQRVQPGQAGYPLRPEMAESTYYLYKATQDPLWLYFGQDILLSLQERCKQSCGYSALKNVTTHEPEDRMDSFFLAETTKYLYLLFDEDNFIEDVDYPHIFNTEGHPLPVAPFVYSRPPRLHTYTNMPVAACPVQSYSRRVGAYGMEIDELTKVEQSRETPRRDHSIFGDPPMCPALHLPLPAIRSMDARDSREKQDEEDEEDGEEPCLSRAFVRDHSFFEEEEDE